MTRRRTQQELPKEHTYLLVPKERFAAEIDERIAAGEAITSRQIGSMDELEAAKSDYYTWNDYNAELLKRRFTTTAVADEYSAFWPASLGGYDSLPQRIEDFRDGVQVKLRRLVSVRERLPLLDVAASVAGAAGPAPAKPVARRTTRRLRSSLFMAGTRRRSSRSRDSSAVEDAPRKGAEGGRH